MDFICNRLEGLLVLDKLTDGVYWRLIRALVWMGLAGEMNLALFKGLQCTGFYHSRRLLGVLLYLRLQQPFFKLGLCP
jgi:hypothetical protein